SQIAELREGGETVLLVKPETFMNLSGHAVRQVVEFYKLSPADLLVVCDDINLPLGKLRARARGTHGGHNGLRHIQEQLGTTEYPRLRIGVGSPSFDATDHVLGRFRPAERPVVEEAIREAADAVLLWVREGIDVCMNRVNGPGPGAKPRKQPGGPGRPEPPPAGE
ncbi:MAG TPA: aminoacyl-tRNA hydrolase, partial [Gemmataceae bacterium]